MSCITENTAIVTNDDYKKYKNIYNFKKIYSNNKNTLVIFDHNGEIQNEYDFNLNNYIIETYYLDNVTAETESDYFECYGTISTMIKRRSLFKELNKQKRNEIIEKIKYSTKTMILNNAISICYQ